jgi:aryl-alcohol dehydrogenase-like predicted oxidoreductase
VGIFENYITLGRSGLRVSSLCLGTATFGLEWGWGTDEDTSRAIFDRYVSAGGNFLDTADAYTNGTSERMVGKFIKEKGVRDRLVIGTKFTVNTDPRNPNAGGNGRKNIYRALESSLQRLEIEYIDLYWMHGWDTITPVEEVISTLDDFVREGKIRHYGFSDVPAWYVARAQTLAEHQGKERLIALQLEYSLLDRHLEREHIPVAQELQMAVCPYSPLAMGYLSGKYEGKVTGVEGRLAKMANSSSVWFTERNSRILAVLVAVAKKIDRTPAQVALSWVATQPGITSTLIGATSREQLEHNLASIEFTIPGDLRRQLDEVSGLPSVRLYESFGSAALASINGTAPVRPWMPARRLGGSED